MPRILLSMLLLMPIASSAEPWFDGAPSFADAESRALAERLLDAHGGMAPMTEAESLQFNFFTKMIGNPTPFYSFEALDLDDGDAFVDWPFFDAAIGKDGDEAWTRNWPLPLPGGFFVRLTSSFLTLPWQLHADGATVGPAATGRLPGDDTEYDVLRVEFETRNPGIPGTFYEVFVDRETGLMAGVKFDINHPGMVANPEQPIGPNYHVFGDYRRFNGLAIPTFYKSYGRGSAQGGESNAYHFVWNLRTDRPFDDRRAKTPPDALIDHVSMAWWGTASKGEDQ